MQGGPPTLAAPTAGRSACAGTTASASHWNTLQHGAPEPSRPASEHPWPALYLPTVPAPYDRGPVPATLADRGRVPDRAHPPGRRDAAPRGGPGHRPQPPPPCRDSAVGSPRPHTCYCRTGTYSRTEPPWNPTHSWSRMPQPSCGPPSEPANPLVRGPDPTSTCQSRCRGSRNASGISSTAPPEHNHNRDAAGIPASPACRPPGRTGSLSKVPPRLQHGSAAGGSQPAT